MRPLIIISFFVVLSGCLESGLDFTPVDNDTVINYDVSSTFSGPNDAFRIVGISPTNDQLNLFLSYSGGCQVHSFKVIWDGEIKAVGDYKEIFLKVFHQSNNDECDALLKPVVTVDLGKVLNGFIPDSQTRIIVQNGSNGRTISIDPRLSKITQGKTCVVKTTLENSLCGYGVWQNNWFRMTDSLKTGNNIWLQPVSYNPEISAKIPSSGTYELGVTLLFGFETPADPSCITIPSGLVIPIEVNCINVIK